MIYEAKFKINRAPLRKLWKAYTDYCESMPENHALTEKHIADCDRKYQAFKNMERLINMDAWNVFMRYGTTDKDPFEYNREIKLSCGEKQNIIKVKFPITETNVYAFHSLLQHLAPVMTTMTRYKLLRTVTHKLMFSQLDTSERLYPVLGTATPFNESEIENSDNGLTEDNLNYQCMMTNLKSSDFKEWKKAGNDKFEFYISVRDTPPFMDYYDDGIEMDCREYYEMTI